MTEKKRTVWVTGHKNPDTDSVCSAIVYAYLKNQLDKDKNYLPIRAGHMNEETHFVLNYFEQESPKYITNVETQIQDIEYRIVEGITENISMHMAYNIMRDLNIKTLPVVRDKELKGLITLGDIAANYMEVLDNRILAKAETPYENILETLKGQLVCGDPSSVFKEGKVLVAAANPDQMEEFIEPHDLVILGNRYESQLCAIEMEADLLIVTQEAKVSKTIQKLALENNCAIIATPFDTYTAARMLNQAMPVGHFMVKDQLLTFKPTDTVESVRNTMAKHRFNYFPIVDDNNLVLGMISKRNLLDMQRKAVIMVDHNERSQAINGIEESEVLEIIDHHRLRSLETMQPVFFRNMPVGCTATIIFMIFNENHVEIPGKMAGLLCAAILSDTLMFRSPTCTESDRQAAEKLAKIAGISINEFGSQMFRAGGNYAERSVEEIFKQDLKSFSSGEHVFEIGQINYMSEEEIEGLEERLMEYMQKRDSAGDVFFMLTSVLDESTKLLFCGETARDIVDDGFHRDTQEHSVILPGVVSRKKQVVPQLISTFQKF